MHLDEYMPYSKSDNHLVLVLPIETGNSLPWFHVNNLSHHLPIVNP